MSIRPRHSSPLRAPRQLASGVETLWIADTGHHRVLGASLEGEVHTIVGAGARPRGLQPASTGFDQPLFMAPRGLASSLDERRILVSDVETGIVWRVDRDERMAHAIAGTGQVSDDARPVGTVFSSPSVSLPAPSALALDENAGALYLAMERVHQIWRLHLDSGRLEVFAGDGAGALRDGSCAQAAFCRPVGLALAPDGRRLYVADAGNAALRVIDLLAAVVTTVVATDAVNGDRSPDGPGTSRMRIGGCIAVAVSPGGLVIVDDALRSIRGVNLRHATVTPGFFDGPLHGIDPAAVTFDRKQRRFIVADVAGHRLLRLSRDLEVVEELPLWRHIA